MLVQLNLRLSQGHVVKFLYTHEQLAVKDGATASGMPVTNHINSLYEPIDSCLPPALYIKGRLSIENIILDIRQINKQTYSQYKIIINKITVQ